MHSSLQSPKVASICSKGSALSTTHNEDLCMDKDEKLIGSVAEAKGKKSNGRDGKIALDLPINSVRIEKLEVATESMNFCKEVFFKIASSLIPLVSSSVLRFFTSRSEARVL